YFGRRRERPKTSEAIPTTAMAKPAPTKSIHVSRPFVFICFVRKMTTPTAAAPTMRCQFRSWNRCGDDVLMDFSEGSGDHFVTASLRRLYHRRTSSAALSSLPPADRALGIEGGERLMRWAGHARSPCAPFRLVVAAWFRKADRGRPARTSRLIPWRTQKRWRS